MRREDRQIFGAWLVFVWMLGFELLPAVHIAVHAHLGDHHHGVPGERAADHCHGDACHSHGPDVEDAEDEPERPGWRATGSRPHGTHSLAHREMAAKPANVDVPPVSSAPARRTPAPRALRQEVPPSHAAEACARGPPMTTRC